MRGKFPRWYQSRLFWIGLAGLVMLLAAWGTQRRALVTLSLTTHRYTYAIGKDASGIELTHTANSRILYGLAGHGPGWNFSRTIPRYESWVPGALTPAFTYAKETDHVVVRIGMWFIVLLYTLIWYLGMIFWLRRKHRLMTNPLDPA